MKTKPEQDNNFKFMQKFDAAPSGIMDTNTQIIAKAKLEQILALPSAETPFATPTRKHNVKALRWIAIPAAVLTVIIGTIVWPNNPVSPTQFAAAHGYMASWQPVPSELTEQEIATIDFSCRPLLMGSASWLRSSWEGDEEQLMGSFDFTIGDLVVAERRGDWGFVAYAHETADDLATISSCFVWFPQHGTTPAMVQHTFFQTINPLGRMAGGDSHLGMMARGEYVDAAGYTQPLPFTWTGEPLIDLSLSAGLPPNRLSQTGLAFNDGSAMNAIVGKMPASGTPVFQTEAGPVTPTVFGDWFLVWWPVEINVADNLANHQCWIDFSSIQLENPDAEPDCESRLPFSPRLQKITLVD